jgi:ubiquinone/menaquinone biosynthesis C-methylase UbiE
MAPKGIECGREHVRRQNLEDTVDLVVADATDLPFPDNEFDIVIGHGVIHHTIKYPGIFENLYRVMKPGTKAYFQENLADFPLWRLWWWLKGEVPDGDVPIFSSEVKEKTQMFSQVEIIGDSFVHAIKTFVYKKNMGSFRRTVLKCSHEADEMLFSACPALRKWGNMSVIVLTKD